MLRSIGHLSQIGFWSTLPTNRFPMDPRFRTSLVSVQNVHKWFNFGCPFLYLPGICQNFHTCISYGSKFTYLLRNWSTFPQMGHIFCTKFSYLQRNWSKFPQMFAPLPELVKISTKVYPLGSRFCNFPNTD